MTTTRFGKRLDFWGRDIKKRSIQWALTEMNRQIQAAKTNQGDKK